MYYVSRQLYWGVAKEDAKTVEIAIGGLDYANPDMLSEKYYRLGEGTDYDNPIEAVKAAVAIADAWQKDEPMSVINVAVGNTGGYTMPFSPSTDDDLMAWAKKEFAKIVRCPVCGKVTENLDQWYVAGEYTESGCFYPFDDDERYCSEFCAAKNSTFPSNEA